MLKVKILALQAVMAVAVVAANGCVIVDDGDGDGNEGEGEGEGEDVILLGPDESCNLTRTDEVCDPGQDLVCVQQGLNPNAGVCRPSCGDNTTGEKDPGITCPTGTSCQVLLSPDLTSASVVCAPEGSRNGNCRALFDEEACVEGDCVPLAISFDDAGDLDTIDALGCRTACNADAECAAGESCVRGGRFGFQGDFEPEQANGANVTCNQATCDAGGAGCECNAEAGFECITFGQDAPTCFRLKGMCATGIAPVTTPGIQDINDIDVTQDDVCNQVEAVRLCDADAFYGDTENPGSSECITGTFFNNDNDGLCFAFCASPTIDRNNNNNIDTGEQGETNNCPTGYECTADMGRAFLLAAAVQDAAGPFGVKSCDPTACTEGEPCDDECGPGDTECVSFASSQGDVSLCLAPFKNCTDVVASCGDGEKNGTEACDGTDLTGAACPANTTGTVSCNADCTLNTSLCVANPTCGNGALDAGEACDGTNINGATCGANTTGTPTCNTDCTLNTGAAVCVPNCGNGTLDEGEACDGANIDGATCGANTTGTPTCNADCTLNTGAAVCVPNCGNGTIDAGEACDGTANTVCPTAGDVGAVCSATCTLDTSACAPPAP